ncbi:hypothetical protein, partial [Nodularia sphaerocarpa]|uniref:hypothetical protein n=1 Tax=Nodularia sphaerocarpa TaxID=137816 RepID=UPI00232C5F8E
IFYKMTTISQGMTTKTLTSLRLIDRNIHFFLVEFVLKASLINYPKSQFQQMAIHRLFVD